jgi:hypothetical protein
MKRILLTMACVGCFASPAVLAQSNQEMLQYLIMQQKQQQQAQQPQHMTGLNEEQWEACMHNAYVAGQMAPKSGGGSLLEGYGQAAQYQQACGPRP